MRFWRVFGILRILKILEFSDFDILKDSLDFRVWRFFWFWRIFGILNILEKIENSRFWDSVTSLKYCLFWNFLGFIDFKILKFRQVLGIFNFWISGEFWSFPEILELSEIRILEDCSGRFLQFLNAEISKNSVGSENFGIFRFRKILENFEIFSFQILKNSLISGFWNFQIF